MGDSLETLIARTQEQLQPLIAKPKLADKLLAKPPFRFLHDVFTAVAQSTGFSQGLYNDFELASANLKDKAQKTAFLDKMIVCVGQCIGKDVDVRSAKIVAGLEPENTNLLLLGIAQAAKDKSLGWDKSVQIALAKVPSLSAEGETSTAAAPNAETAAAAPRPFSKDRSGSAEVKEKARRDKDAAPAVAPPRSAESKGDGGSHTLESLAPSKQTAPDTNRTVSARTSSASKESSRSGKDNNLDEVLLQNIAECNGDVERTKTFIEQVISKPKMSAKLLGKPPFRFLHDIVSEITRVTGFAEGLFSGDELDSGAIKEKGPKMDYLTKIILCVGCQLNVEVEAKSAKIVAGLEPEATCKFLQLLSIACRSGSSNEAVQRVLAGDTAVRNANVKKSSSREAAPESKQASRSSTPQDKLRISQQPVAEAKENAKEAEPGSFSGAVKPLAVKGITSGADNDNEKDDDHLHFKAGFAEVKTGDGGDSARIGTSAPGTSGTSRTSRPTTARRRPPKLKENVTEVGRLHVHDTKAVPVVGIMKDGDNGDTDSEDEAGGGIGVGGDNSQPHTTLLPGDGGAHGRLVRDILKDQNAEEAARRAKEGEDMATTTNEAETGIRLGRRTKSFKPDRTKSSNTAAASSLAEMNALRADIQRLCQAANPVGKSVEFVHEDLDAMSKELEFWRKEYARKRDALVDEQKHTEEALQPLQIQLREVEEQVKEQLHKINTLKAVISKNEEKTQQLLRMVVSA
ncbi:TRAF3-interacting protein 1 [Phytophthora boehmeriae]|uniref:TRAF3-interacting protein 1 n=1 Tax=Phytophthora boehmeriae TaxID=109152 RepID=A0A8T1VRE1_9STRA|nr:TRAF3-interacting protein 1 [Phytophthora boehmeriae]